MSRKVEDEGLLPLQRKANEIQCKFNDAVGDSLEEAEDVLEGGSIGGGREGEERTEGWVRSYSHADRSC